MTPEQQRLTFEVARGLQAGAAKRYLADGWSLSEKHDETTRETPLVKSFDRLSDDQKKPYYNGAANAVMQLLEEGYGLAPSETPDIPLPEDIRKSAERSLVAGGRTEAEARDAVDAIEAAGFAIAAPLSPEMKKMQGYYKMSVVEMGDEKFAVSATINMAFKEGIRYEDINAFLQQRNASVADMGGRALHPLLSEQDAADWIVKDLSKEYAKALNFHRDEAARRGAAVLPDGSLADASENALASRRAIETARETIIPALGRVPEPLRTGVIKGLMSEEGRFASKMSDDVSVGSQRWMDTLAKAREKDMEILDIKEEHEAAMRRWKNLKWYEKVFVPRPLPPDKKTLDTLMKEREDLMAQCRMEFNEDNDAVRTMRLADGSVAKIGMRVDDGNLSLLMAVDRDGLMQMTQRVFLPGGSYNELSASKEMARSAAVQALAGSAELVPEDVLMQRFDTMTRTIKEEMELSPQDRLSSKKDSAESVVSLEEAYAAHERYQKERALAEERKTETEGKEKAAEERKEQGEWMPSLHPNLAGDISQKDVDILMAFRFNGGKKEDVLGMIDSLKEKKQIVYTGFVTYRPAEGYDGNRYIPVKHVSIGLRLGNDGHITVYNPNTGKDLGSIRKALASPSLNSARKPVKDTEKEKKQQKKKEDKPKIHFSS